MSIAAEEKADSTLQKGKGKKFSWTVDEEYTFSLLLWENLRNDPITDRLPRNENDRFFLDQFLDICLTEKVLKTKLQDLDEPREKMALRLGQKFKTIYHRYLVRTQLLYTGRTKLQTK